MGVDCSDIRQVITCGVPEDVETYIQHVGRAGRDGKPSLALFVPMSSKSTNKVSANMREYNITNNKTCKKKVLFSDIDEYEHKDKIPKCLCCDVCQSECDCVNCEKNLSSFVFL